MYIDKSLLLLGTTSGNTIVPTSIATFVVGDNASPDAYLDLLKATPGDYGIGERLFVGIAITTGVTCATGAGSLLFKLEQADDTVFATNKQTICQTAPYVVNTTVGAGQLPAGAFCPMVWDDALPYPSRRYIRLTATVGTYNLATGAGLAFVTKDLSTLYTTGTPAFQSGFAVL